MKPTAISSAAAQRHGSLGLLLRTYRRTAGLTQLQLAEIAGVSLGALRDIEQGRTAMSRRATLKSLVAALDLSEDQRTKLQSLADIQRYANRTLPLQRTGAEDARERRVRLELLGPLQAWRIGTPVALGHIRQQALVVMLALSGGAGVSRATLVDVLWQSNPPATALEMLHSYVTRVRRCLGSSDEDPDSTRQPAEDLLVWTGSAYRLAPGAVRSDVEDFDALAERAEHASAAGDIAEACELYDQALQLWRGAPVAGLEMMQDHPAVIELRERRARIVTSYAAIAETTGQNERVIRHLRAVAQQDPLDERVHARLMIALLVTGQQAAALRVYEDLRHRLDEELGVSPGPELAAAHLRVLRQDFSAAISAPTALSGSAATAGGSDNRTSRRMAMDLPVPRQLPAATPHFAGRAAELAALEEMLDQADRAPGTGLIVSVVGGAGVGKTALAVTCAHRVADRFPDGQLYINLRGYGPSHRPVAPDEAIRSFLDALHVLPKHISGGLDARAGLYRTLLADKRMLIVLDNARSADQVRPLLPGSPGCAVVVTSRGELTGLVAEGARPLRLDILTQDDARALLAARLGVARLASEVESADELIGFCARLPLALSVAAARAARHPDSPLATIVSEFRDERRRLDALDTGEAATAVRAAFSCSYRLLNRSAARLFILLGIHPGQDITLPAAASLAGVAPGEATRALSELTRVGLLTEHSVGRFACHDLLRTYAAERRRSCPDIGARTAMQRILDYYLHTCYAAGHLFDASREPVALAAPLSGARPESFSSFAAAQAWCLAEYPALVTAVADAAQGGFTRHAWQLAWAADTFLHRQARWNDSIAIQEIALAAAEQQRDLAGEAHARSGLGRALAMLGVLDRARSHLCRAITLFQQLADPGGEATARIRVGLVSTRQGQHAEARAHARDAWELYQITGNRTGQAAALNNHGWYAICLGQHRQALSCCQEALDIFRELGDLRGQAVAHNSIATAYLHLRRIDQCIEHCRSSTELLETVSDPWNLASTLEILGDAHYATHNSRVARQVWNQALEVLDQADSPTTRQIREKLRRIDTPHSRVSPGTAPIEVCSGVNV